MSWMYLGAWKGINMKPSRIFLFALALIAFPLAASAKDLAWLEIYSKYDYRDVTSRCSNLGMSIPIYLSAEVDESGRAQIVVLTKQPEWPLAERFYLTKEEAAGVRFYKDDAGRQWLQSLRISPRMAYWIMLRTDFNVFPCLKSEFSTLEPETVLDFDLEGINEGIGVTLSQQAEFGGKLASDYSYEAELLLNQRQTEKGQEK